MSTFNLSRSRQLLQEFDFNTLFVEELGWEEPSLLPDRVICDEQGYKRTPVASLSGAMVFELLADDGQMADAKARLAVEKLIRQHYHENLLIFVNAQRTYSVWYWVKREGNKHFPRSHDYVALREFVWCEFLRSPVLVSVKTYYVRNEYYRHFGMLHQFRTLRLMIKQV